MNRKNPIPKSKRGVSGRDLAGGHSAKDPQPLNSKGGRIDVSHNYSFGSRKVLLLVCFVLLSIYGFIGITLFLKGLEFLSILLLVLPLILFSLFLFIGSKMP